MSSGKPTRVNLSNDLKMLIEAGKITREEAFKRALQRQAERAAVRGGGGSQQDPKGPTEEHEPGTEPGTGPAQSGSSSSEESGSSSEEESTEDEGDVTPRLDELEKDAEPKPVAGRRRKRQVVDDDDEEEEAAADAQAKKAKKATEEGAKGAKEGKVKTGKTAGQAAKQATPKRKPNPKPKAKAKGKDEQDKVSDGQYRLGSDIQSSEEEEEVDEPKRRSGSNRRPAMDAMAAALPGDDELAAFAAAAGGDQEEERPTVVGEKALAVLPALDALFKGEPHSLYSVHKSNPDPRCRPVFYKKTVAKKGGKTEEVVDCFPGQHGDFRMLANDLVQSNIMMGFFFGGKDSGSMWEAVTHRIAGLQATTKPAMHMALLAAVLHVVGAGELFERWLYYHGSDWKKAFLTLPQGHAGMVPPGFQSGADPRDNRVNVRKTMWAWAFGPDKELPTEEEMRAKGGPPTEEEMYGVAVQLWGLPADHE